MPKRRSNNRTFVLSAKWILRAFSLVLLALALGFFFIPQVVYLKLVGLLFAGAVIGLILAEFTDSMGDV